MSDKDLLVVISEMLRKQDQQAEILAKHTQILGETNETLKNFVDVSIQQFQQQDNFNAHFLAELKKQDAQFERQNHFNERFLEKLDEIAKKL
jgi:hypothetical protein